MGMIIATSGAELMSGDSQNVISDYEGTAMLAPLYNMNPDPLFDSFDTVTDAIKYWNMGSSPKPDGWIPFVRDTTIEKNFSRQATAPLPLSQHIMEIPDELVPGATPRDVKDTVDIAAPLSPKVQTYLVSSTVGYPAGWYCLAHDWMTGVGRTTGPGDRSEAFYLAQGQGFEFVTPTEIPDGIKYLQPYLTPPQASAAAALSAPLYIQTTYRIATMPRRTPMYGPLHLSNRTDSKNYTFIGGTTNTLKPIRVANYSARAGYGAWTEGISLSYRFVTDQGEGMSSPLKNVTVAWSSDENALLLWAIPPSTPSGATGWILEITSQDPEDGALTKYDVFKFGGTPFKVNEWAPVYGGQPEYLVAGAAVEMVSNTATSTIDNTGIEAPDGVMELPTVLDLESSGLTPGRHYVKTALFVGEEEGPASNYTLKSVPFGHGLRIHKPRWHDRLDNSDLSDRNVDGRPRDWQLFDVESNAQVFTEKRNVIRITDKTTNNADANFFVTPPAELDPQYGRYTLNMRFKWMDYLRGVITVHMKEYDSAGNLLATQQLETLGRNAKSNKADKNGVLQTVKRSYYLSKRDDDVASPKFKKMNVNTTTVKLDVRGKIRRRKSTTEYRYLDAELSDFAMTAGWSTPRVVDINFDVLNVKRTVEAPPPHSVAETRYKDFSRPHGGYCLVVEDPIDGPKKLTYTLKDFTIFESGTNEGWQKNQASLVYYLNAVQREAALHSAYGLHLAKTGDGTGSNNVVKTFTPTSTMTISWSMFIDTFSEHNIELGSIEDANGAVLARVTLLANGDVTVRHSDTKIQTVDLGIDDGQEVFFELSCNMNTKVVTLTFGLDEENQSEVVRITDIDFSAFQNAAAAVLGIRNDSGVNDFARFDMYYGKIMVTDLRVLDTVTDLPGNYIEYYGPTGTPKNPRYGPTGLRIPAQGSNTYTIGVNIWYEDMTSGSSLWKIRAKDKDHNTLRTYAPLVSNMSGDKRRWERTNRSLTTPPNTAYLEFFENDLGAGILKIHALQVEEGAVAHEFSYERQTNGWFSTYFRTRQASIEKGDPAIEIARVKRLRDVLVASVDTPQLTTSVSYRAGDNFSELYAAPYITDYTLLNMDKSIVEVRVDMASTIQGDTPEVRGIQMDVERPFSQLLRPDGTEYSGGTIAFDISTPTEPPNMEILTKASGGKEAQTWGTERVRGVKFRVAAFRRSDVADIVSQDEHVLEMPEARYTVIANEAPTFLAEPGTRVYFPDGREFLQREIAEIEGFITYEEPLVSYAE